MAWKTPNYASFFTVSRKKIKRVLSKCSCGTETFDIDKICAICRLEAKFLKIYDLHEIEEYSKSCLNVFTSGHTTLRELFNLKENNI